MRLITALGLSLVASQAASDPVLSFPLDCVLGDSCHIQQYVDRDPGPGARDFTCAGLSYDGHKGTDFSLPSLEAMETGVAVLAAAPGIVTGLRDQISDQFYTQERAAGVDGIECGNGVLIRHADGWETQYCHLKRGSVRVQPNQRVERGEVLGEVGLSGKTQFPHLHLSVRHNGQVVDPFAISSTTTCGQNDAHLWADLPPYTPGAVISAGFAPRVPSYAEIHTGETAYGTLPADGDALVLWGFAFGGRKGDVVRIEIEGPNGPFARHDSTLDKDQARFFRAYGKRLKAKRWAPGTYSGRVTLLRDGKAISMTSTLTRIY